MIDPGFVAILQEPERQAIELCTALATGEVERVRASGAQPVAQWVAGAILDRFIERSLLAFTVAGGRRFVDLIAADVLGAKVNREVARILASEARAFAERCRVEANVIHAELARRARVKLSGNEGSERDD